MKKREKVSEGKTKILYEVDSEPDRIIIENKDDITKHDDPAQTKTMQRKAELATITTCIVFEILEMAGIPLAYLKKIGKTTFLAIRCRMIRVEVVVRRYAVGSCLYRYPELKKEGKIPHQFNQLCCEFFLKTSGGTIVSKDGKVIGQLPIDPETKRPIDDPFIADPTASKWKLYHPKKPINKDSYLCTVFRDDFLPKGTIVERMTMIALKTFLVLEETFHLLGLKLIDFKVEFGIGPDGKIRLADVIDNDSWRLMNSKWEELSKELFRQGQSMEKVREGYEFVVKMLQKVHSLK